MKYYNIITKIITNELKAENKENDDSTLQYAISDDEQKDNESVYNVNKYMNNISQIIPNANSTLPYSFQVNNNSIFSKTERIPIKNKFLNSNFTKMNKNLINNSDNNNFLENFILKNSTISNKAINKNKKFINEKSKTGRSRRTLSYGNLEVKINKDNESYKMFLNKNNNILNNSNIINSTKSLKSIFPSYAITSPTGLLYPIIFTNKKENYINNNNLNNNILFNYQGNNAINFNNKKKDNPKPSLWYTNIFSPINGISINQDNSYAIPKILNNSANFNSIQNFNLNYYSEDYLNKQIFDFINSNSKTKQDIIYNRSKKNNFNLNKSNGEIKINDKNNKPNSNKYFY